MNAVVARGVNEKFCSDCGGVISARAELCPKCGVRQMAPPAAAPQKSRMVAVLLALLLGGLGFHKFYLGRGVQGLLYLIFCWTFVPALIAFCEAIVYLVTSDADFAAKYG